MTNSRGRGSWRGGALAVVALALVAVAPIAAAAASATATTTTTTPLVIFTIPAAAPPASPLPPPPPPPPQQQLLQAQQARPATATAAPPPDNNATAAAAVAVAAASAPPPPPQQTQGRPIAGSVLLLGEYDWQVSPGSDGNPWSPCADMTRRALAQTRSSAIQYVPTQGFMLGPASTIERFCTFVQGVPGQPSPCQPLDTSPASAARLAAFKRDMEHCFLVAMRSGARTIALRSHLDSGAGDGAWRNSLLLEPSVAYGGGGLSYEDVMINPLADALAGAQKKWAQEIKDQQLQHPLPQIDFALQGEMSATVVRFPEQWRALVEKVRSRASAPGCPRVRMGVGLNWNRLDDLSSVSQTHESSRLSWASWALGVSDIGRGGNAAAIDGKAFGDLLQSVDFVSVSAYAPISGPGFNPNELGNSAFNLVDQLEEIGVPGAKTLFKPGGLELVYGEIGLGGGSSYKGTTRATSPSEVALRPFFGVYGEHDESHDPWAIPANAAFRREFYSKVEAWMAGGNANKAIPISGIYLWGKSSFDVLGIYDHGYDDAEVARGIQRYNCAAGAGLWDCADGGGTAGGSSGGDGGDGDNAAVVTVSSGT